MIELPISGCKENYLVSPSKIIAIGLNYVDHISESASLKVRGVDGNIPEEPVLFSKTPNVLLAPNQNIVIPQCIADYTWIQRPRTDYEGELVVIMGRGGKHISEREASDHVFGFTCGNDVSQRNLQNSDRSGWYRGKSFDTFGPVGPVVLPLDQVHDPQNLKLETRLNGKIVQSASTKQMIFPVSRLISFISRQMTLEEGDLIFTGTPAGVGPLIQGDVIEVEIEKIGVLKNCVVNEVQN